MTMHPDFATMKTTNQTAEQQIASLNLTEQDFPYLMRWTDKEHLLKTLQGIAKASNCSLKTAATNLELDLGMM